MKRLLLCLLAAVILSTAGCAMSDLFDFLTDGAQNSNDYTQQNYANSFGRQQRP